MNATVEVDHVADEVAHAYVAGFTKDVHFEDEEDDSPVMIYCQREGRVWVASVNSTDEWLAEASSLRVLARRLARRFGHDVATATIQIHDERRSR